MAFTDLLTTSGLLVAIMAIVQFLKTKVINPNVVERYRKFVVIAVVIATGFALGFLAYYMNTIFMWLSDITPSDVAIMVLEAEFTAIVINQVWKGTTKAIKG